jgi:hypothetical protein
MADYNGSVGVKSIRDDELKIIIVDGASGDVATQKLAIDANGAANVHATDFDIRNITAAQDSIAVSDGTNVLAINADGSINASITEFGTRYVSYKKGTAVAKDATDVLDYVITDTKLFSGLGILVGARGAVKVEIAFAVDGATFVNKYVYFQQPSMNFYQKIEGLSILSTGLQAIKVTVTNLDDSASDLYTSIEFVEK